MSNAKALTPEGRFRWVNVFTAKRNYNGDKDVKSIALMIPKKSSLKNLETAYRQAAVEEFKGKIPGALRKLTGGQKPILKDGDEVYDTRDDDKKPMYEEYRGCWILQPEADANFPLRILGPDGAELFDPADIYDGAYGQLVINMSAYSAKSRPGFPGGPMMSVSLLGVKKTRDGEVIETTGGATALSDAEVASLFGSAAVDSTDDL